MLKTVKIRQIIIIILSSLICLVLLYKLISPNKNLQLLELNNNNNNNNNNNKYENKDGSNNLFGLRLNDQMELSQKLDDIAEKLLKQQEKRLSQLEEDKINLERQLNEMKKPSSDLSLREKLAFLYPYDQNKKFPAYIWQTWKYGLNDNKFGKEYKQGEEQWAIQNPGFVHELFNDDTSRAIIRYLYRNIPEIVKVYDSLPHVILRSDFFRFLILFAKGGIYADVDTLPLQPIPNWIPENVDPSELGMIIGIESDPIDKNWRKFYSRRLQFANWVIQSKPGHPILREIIASITDISLEKIKKNENQIRSENDKEFILDVMNWTGDGIFTDVILRYFNDYVLSGIFSKVTWKDFTKMDVPKLVSDVLVLPVNSFGVEDKESKESKELNEIKQVPKNAIDVSDQSHPLAFVKHYKHRVFKQS
ncbi:membrane-bound alpha-1,6- mannosyltransferase Initiation-specific [Pichia californica]|uniref:Membrane-bound alpha-1,6- mannosyltransferase Initiation-specific n=1 Tax=Pichia californica TaxID=460514 RepID=A0A9P7BEB9_9ASCO|nr:membrane-bound alpha-1,6- mannosyltransferase Initiation-specific [[Candida] californica]